MKPGDLVDNGGRSNYCAVNRGTGIYVNVRPGALGIFLYEDKNYLPDGAEVALFDGGVLHFAKGVLSVVNKS